MEEGLKPVALKCGLWVWCRTVPPLAYIGVTSKYPFPPAPKIEVGTLAGSEEVSAPDDSPEMRAWLAECEVVENRRRQAANDFVYDYGIAAWSETEDGERLTDPPENWEPDRALVKHLPPEMLADWRLAFIKFRLITTLQDKNAVDAVIHDEELPLTQEEIGAAEDSFPGDV